MAAHKNVLTQAATWTALTDEDVTDIRVQNLSDQDMTLQATADGTAPTSGAGGLRLSAGGIILNETLADLFPGVSGAARVWAYAPNIGAVSVSHG